MKKTLGQIAYEAYDPSGEWSQEHDIIRCVWKFVGNRAKRAVLRELRREGRLAPVKSQIISVTKARKK